MSLLYFFFTGVVIAAGLLIILTPHVLYAAFGLLGVLLGLAAIYFLQGAAFVAIAQVLIYGSGILVLLLFSSLLLPLDIRPTLMRRQWMVSGAVVVLVGGVLGPLVFWAGRLLNAEVVVTALPDDVVAMLGFQLVGPYALAFEWTGVILLVALVGALYLLKAHK